MKSGGVLAAKITDIDRQHSFSLSERIDSRPIGILSFKQLEESIGVAWARFLRLFASKPDLYIPDDVLLDIYLLGFRHEVCPRPQHRHNFAGSMI